MQRELRAVFPPAVRRYTGAFRRHPKRAERPRLASGAVYERERWRRPRTVGILSAADKPRAPLSRATAAAGKPECGSNSTHYAGDRIDLADGRFCPPAVAGGPAVVRIGNHLASHGGATLTLKQLQSTVHTTPRRERGSHS
jgi:hypothetical protein